MTAGVVALQIVRPLTLLVWLASAPAVGWAAYALHVGATAVVLLALWLVDVGDAAVVAAVGLRSVPPRARGLAGGGRPGGGRHFSPRDGRARRR